VNFVRLLPVVISALLMAAHFMRAGQELLMALSLTLPLLLLLKHRAVPLIVSVALVLGALEWVYTLVKIAAFRADMGASWGRMAWILGLVALFTACSALVFRLRGVRARYNGAPAAG
jgi:hypothetical protein